MKKKTTKPQKSDTQQMVDDTVSQIGQLLHIELPINKLIPIRDTIISKRIRNWDKKIIYWKSFKISSWESKP